MAPRSIQNYPYTFERTLQHSADHVPPSANLHKHTGHFTWLVFMQVKWVPFDARNQDKLEQTLILGGTFVDIQDSHFPQVKRVRAFPKLYYVSYLGVKYRLSRVMQPDAWTVPLVEEERPGLCPPPALAMSDDGNSSEESYVLSPLQFASSLDMA